MIEKIYPKPEANGRNIITAVQWGPDNNTVSLGTVVNVAGQDRTDLVEFLFGDHAKLERIGYATRDALAELAATATDVAGAQTKDEERTHAVLLGRQVIDLVRAQDGSVEGSLWSILDRPGVNRLIKVLRRARDAAFGRDE